MGGCIVGHRKKFCMAIIGNHRQRYIRDFRMTLRRIRLGGKENYLVESSKPVGKTCEQTAGARHLWLIRDFAVVGAVAGGLVVLLFGLPTAGGGRGRFVLG